MRSFSYLASGQVSQDVRDPSHTYTFAANDNGRNASASLNGSTVGSYLYNAFEQRVQKVAGGVTTQFVFDRFGHLLEEANGSGALQQEYIWLDDLPVAMVDDTGVIAGSLLHPHRPARHAAEDHRRQCQRRVGWPVRSLRQHDHHHRRELGHGHLGQLHTGTDNAAVTQQTCASPDNMPTPKLRSIKTGTAITILR